MAKFGDMSPEEALTKPEFYEALFDHCEMDQKERNELWEKIRRPDLKK